MKGMPEFETEEEFNKFFEKETAYVNQFRDEDGCIRFKDDEEFMPQFTRFMNGLLEINKDDINIEWEVVEE